jgi:GTP cyclohydrolase N terminal
MATNDDVVRLLRDLKSQISTLVSDNAAIRKEMASMPRSSPASTSGTLRTPPLPEPRLNPHAGQRTAADPALPTLSRHDPLPERSAAHLAAADARPRSGSGTWGPTKKIVLQTYPKQAGVNPVPMDWGNSDAQSRGPVVVSHSASTVKRRNGEDCRRLRTR